MNSIGSFFIICAGATVSLLVFLGFIAVIRYINYKETLSLAEKGIVRPERTPRQGRGLLIWGIMVTAVGMALCLGLYPLGLSSSGRTYPLGLGPWMIVGLLPLFIGIGLVLVYVITGDSGGVKPVPPAVPPVETVMPPVPPAPEPVEEPTKEE